MLGVWVGMSVLFSGVARADDAAARHYAVYAQSWLSLAVQTCVAQAPNHPAIAKLNLDAAHLDYTCRCVVKDVFPQLSTQERDGLYEQMRRRQNLQSVGAQLFSRPEVKKTALTCSAAYYWQ